MATLICGSLAFDSIATFPGRFADQILPEKLHILNVSFLVPGLRREFGGCAGNIAYNARGPRRRKPWWWRRSAATGSATSSGCSRGAWRPKRCARSTTPSPPRPSS